MDTNIQMATNTDGRRHPQLFVALAYIRILVYYIRMPYIPQKDRIKLDPFIDSLAEEIVSISKKEGNDAAYAGFLNYVCTRLALKIIKLQFGKARYWIIATTTGVFHNAADEFYRRFAVPYENGKSKKDGDVDLYEEFEKEMT